jgi:hypothetical protein
MTLRRRSSLRWESNSHNYRRTGAGASTQKVRSYGRRLGVGVLRLSGDYPCLVVQRLPMCDDVSLFAAAKTRPARAHRGILGGLPFYDDPRTWNRGQRSRAAGGYQMGRKRRGARDSTRVRHPPSPGLVLRRETSAVESAPGRCSLAPRADRNASAGGGEEHERRRVGHFLIYLLYLRR